jgi:hypothetical protein
MEFRQASHTLTAKLTPSEKKEHGIFFTPGSIRKAVLNAALPLVKSATPLSILEPSCGSGEFICDLYEQKELDIKITAVENNPTIVKELKLPSTTRVIGGDFLTTDVGNGYDLIIGNPPYVVIKKASLPKEYASVCFGRPNLFVCFIKKSIDLLSDRGVMAFVLPKTVMTSAYYQGIRDYILRQCEIANIIDFSDSNAYLETKQETIGLILRKTATVVKSGFEYNGKFQFSGENLHTKFLNSKPLKDLGFICKGGHIVWNQVKQQLCHKDDPSEKCFLLYNTNISPINTLVETQFSSEEKKQYIKAPQRTISTTFIAVNRGNGNSKYKFKFALVENGKHNGIPVIPENHINIIYHENANRTVALWEYFKTLGETLPFVKNGALSRSELDMFPCPSGI